MDKKAAVEDLKTLGEYRSMSSIREQHFYKERKRRDRLIEKKLNVNVDA